MTNHWTQISKPLWKCLLLHIVLAPSANASERYLDYFFKEPHLAAADRSMEFKRIVDWIDARDYIEAEKSMDEFMARVDAENMDAIPYAKLLADAGIIKGITTNTDEAMLLLQKGIEKIEGVNGPFDMTLVDLLIARGLIASDAELYKEAEQDLRRAQHITHRHEGVYTRNQLPIIDQLTDLDLVQGDVMDADREQRFDLKISEQAYGENSEEIVPVLERLGLYFGTRGFSIPPLPAQYADSEAYSTQYRAGLFRESIGLYNRAIKIIEDNYGPNDMRLIEPLRGLAKTRLRQGTSKKRAEEAMERVLGIVASNPATDVADHAQALANLGDVYTITSDRRASVRYLEAWNLLTESGETELLELRNELFGTPTRLFPERPTLRVLDRRPLAAEDGDPLFADVEFTVEDSGKVSSVTVLDGNIPNDDRNTLRRDLRSARYRPRLVEGAPVNTEGLMLHQTYKVVQTEPEPKLSIQVGPLVPDKPSL